LFENSSVALELSNQNFYLKLPTLLLNALQSAIDLGTRAITLEIRPYERSMFVPRNVREILKGEEDPGQDTTFCRLERFFRVQLHFIGIFQSLYGLLPSNFPFSSISPRHFKGISSIWKLFALLFGF
jgi:hypothetical protein